MLRHLSDTATVWSAIAALWALAAAWYTYHATVVANHENVFDGLQNMIVGIRKELDLISLWAGPEDNAPGYLDSKSRNEYFAEMADRRYPDRMIYTFDYPTIKNLTSSQYVRFLEPIISEFVILTFSIVRLYNYYNEYRSFVISQPSIRRSVDRKLATQGTTPLSPDEARFVEEVFGYNYFIHVKLIGGSDSKDERCLHFSFRRARRSLQAFSSQLKPQAPPRWHAMLHLAAALFVIAGAILMIEWVVMMRSCP